MSALRFVTLKGKEIATILEDLGRLRIAVFRDFPYIYEGNTEYELDYLAIYPRSERSLVFAVYDGEQLVGATTCLPLSDEFEAIIKPFEWVGIDPDTVMYFGESVLLPTYRGQGLGHRFFDERERFARELGFEITAFCSVNRPEDHPLRPAGYRSNDAFWQKRGYVPDPEIVCSMSWPDLGETEHSLKTLTFWLKRWR